MTQPQQLPDVMMRAMRVAHGIVALDCHGGDSLAYLRDELEDTPAEGGEAFLLALVAAATSAHAGVLLARVAQTGEDIDALLAGVAAERETRFEGEGPS